MDEGMDASMCLEECIYLDTQDSSLDRGYAYPCSCKGLVVGKIDA